MKNLEKTSDKRCPRCSSVLQFNSVGRFVCLACHKTYDYDTYRRMRHNLDKPTYQDNLIYKLFHRKELEAEHTFIQTHIRRRIASFEELWLERQSLYKQKEFEQYGHVYGVSAELRLRARLKVVQSLYDAAHKEGSKISARGVW